MDEPFYYLSAEDVVPRDAVHVIVGGSVKVVPRSTFSEHQNLARVELQEGVQEIGAGAFADCPNLERVDCPSSLRTIDWDSFYGCERLVEVILREGLEDIGGAAFCECALERIAVPSSVVTIGDNAFAWCERLSELNLREGLRKIGATAFNGCAFERITVPSSVVEIGEEAFADCDNLEAAVLAGGMVMVANSFCDCHRLERIAISSTAIVVEAGEDGSGRVTAVMTGGIERDPANENPQLILASPHLGSMRLEQLRNLTDAIDGIADAARGAGPLDLTVGDVSGRFRDYFVDHLSTWYRWYKNEVATILELGLWKIELGRAREASRSRTAGGEETVGAAIPNRDASRLTCGADPIVGLVLSSLAGSHCQAD